MVNFFSIPAWSLSAEAFFYVVFPFLFLRLRPSSRARAALWSTAFWLLAMAVPLYCVWRTPDAAWHEGVGGLLVFGTRRIPLLLLPEFLAGIPLAWVFLRFRPGPRAAWVLLLVGATGLFLGLFFSQYLPFVMISNGVLLPFYAMLILGLCEDNWVTRALSVSPLVLLGEASYALYLFHFMMNDWLEQRMGMGWSLMDAVWKVALIVPAAIALHLLVEKPCRKALLQWWNGRHPRMAARM